MKTIECRFCQVTSPLTQDGTRCAGCGMPKANAKIKQRKKTKRDRRGDCPACGCPRCKPLDNHRRICPKCGTEFELPDFGFVDDRPEMNAAKKGL